MISSQLLKRFREKFLIRQITPVILGSVVLVSASCSNVREFAGGAAKAGSPEVNAETPVQDEGVQHAYAAKKDDESFVKLLQYKMQQGDKKSAATQTSNQNLQRSVQELMAAGQDPFIDSTPITPQVQQVAYKASPAPFPTSSVAKSSLPLPVLDLSTTETAPPLAVVAQPEFNRQVLQSELASASETSGWSVEEQAEPMQTGLSEVFIEEPPISSIETSKAQTAPAFPTARLTTADTKVVAETALAKEPTSGSPVSRLTEASLPAVPAATIAEPQLAHMGVQTPYCPPPSEAPVAPYCPTDSYCPPGFTGSPVQSYPSIPRLDFPEIVGDEYIHDGGDRGTKVYYSKFNRFGLDVEDTVAEWHDDVGVAHVKPSTRATIYAPKFASVRSASLPSVGVRVEKVAGHQAQNRLAGIDTKLIIDERTHNDEALGMRFRTRPSGVDARAVDTSVHQNIAPQRHVKLLNVYEEFVFFREGQIDRVNQAVIGNAMAAAMDWSGDQGVNIYAHDLAGQEVQARFTAQDYTAVEDRSTPGDLQIVKVVDKAVAKPGDVLTFTIRFDNVGDRLIQNVRVVDNLSPRLKYLEGTVDSDLDGKLDTENNGQGSQVLTFSFEGDLKGHTGGWVSFKTQVR